MSSASSKPLYLKMASTMPSFSVENGLCLADLGFLDDEERLVVGDGETGLRGDDRGRPRDRVGRSRARRRPSRRLAKQVLLGAVDEVAAFRLQLCEEARRRSLASTSRLPSAEQPDPLSFVLLMRVLRAASSMFGRLVDDHRGVAGADAVGRLARTVGGLDHRGTAGGDRQIAARHQLVGERNARPLDALQQVVRHAECLQGGAHHPHRLDGRLAARRDAARRSPRPCT